MKQIVFHSLAMKDLQKLSSVFPQKDHVLSLTLFSSFSIIRIEKFLNEFDKITLLII